MPEFRLNIEATLSDSSPSRISDYHIRGHAEVQGRQIMILLTRYRPFTSPPQMQVQCNAAAHNRLRHKLSPSPKSLLMIVNCLA